MPILQSYNKRNNAWVKYKFIKGKKGGRTIKVLNVKQRNPKVPFKGVKIASTSMRP